MQVLILGMSQDFSFENGETLNYALLQLPTGEVIRAEVSQEAALAITRSFLGATRPVSAPQPPAPPFFASDPTEEVQGYTPAELTDDGDTVFGNDEAPALDMGLIQQNLDAARDRVAPVVMGSAALNPAELQQAVASVKREGAPLPIPNGGARRAPRVEKDEYGYPRLSGQGYVDPGEISSGDQEGEEDRVGQI